MGELKDARTALLLDFARPTLPGRRAKVARARTRSRPSATAKSWELRAAMSLARVWCDQGKVQQARELLAPV
jgi:predicted ATPase